jgi:hypothetical protein
LYLFLGNVAGMNLVLLVFNLLPIFPLDGGQILWALLWYGLGRWLALQIVSIVGAVVGAFFFFLITATILNGGLSGTLFAILFAFICGFVVLRSMSAFQAARYMVQLESLPRHTHCACPACGTPPPCGQFWSCEHCHERFDTFATRGKCPACGAWYLDTTCPHCRATNHIDRWFPHQVAITTPHGFGVEIGEKTARPPEFT